MYHSINIIPILFVLLMIFCSPATAGIETIKVNNTTVTISGVGTSSLTMSEQELLKKRLITYQSIMERYVNKFVINISFLANSKAISFSNGNAYECKIDMVYNGNKKPVLLNNLNDDIFFTILHELAHCVLTREIMFLPMDWIDIHPASGEIQQFINREEYKFLMQKNYYPPPMLVYHEIFADTLTTLILKFYGEKNFNQNMRILIEKRKHVALHNKRAEHMSYKSLEEVQDLNIKNYHENDLLKLATQISQKNFLLYLNKRRANNKDLGK